MVQILALKNAPEWLAALVAQQWQVWGYARPEDLADFFRAGLTGAFPQTWLAVAGPQLLGSVSLSLHEMGDAQPAARAVWLGFLLVQEDARGQGLGRRLMQVAEQAAAAQGIGTLYLYTADQAERYGRWGWQALETVQFQGEPVVVMVKTQPVSQGAAP